MAHLLAIIQAGLHLHPPRMCIGVGEHVDCGVHQIRNFRVARSLVQSDCGDQAGQMAGGGVSCQSLVI